MHLPPVELSHLVVPATTAATPVTRRLTAQPKMPQPAMAVVNRVTSRVNAPMDVLTQLPVVLAEMRRLAIVAVTQAISHVTVR